MGLDTKAKDWQVCGVVDVAGGVGFGAGLFVFDFYSPTADISARFVFKGVGIGEGGNASGTALGGDLGEFTSFSEIKVVNPFSVWDLNGAWGRVGSVGAGIAVSFGLVVVTAAPLWAWSGSRSFFVSQSVGGFGTGLGAAGVWLVGNWRFKKVTNNKPASEYIA